MTTEIPRASKPGHLPLTPGGLHPHIFFQPLRLRTPASPRPTSLPPRSPSPRLLRPPALSAFSPALPCFLPVLGGAGGGAGPPPPSSLSGGGGAEAAMEWGTRVSDVGGRTRPRAVPSPGKGVGGNTGPRAVATQSAAEGRRRSEVVRSHWSQPHCPPVAAATGTGTRLGRHH